MPINGASALLSVPPCGDQELVSLLSKQTPETPITPLSEVTNSDFMVAIFTDLHPDERPFIVGVVGKIGKAKNNFSNGGGWTKEVDTDVGIDRLNYYCSLATYRPEGGEYR